MLHINTSFDDADAQALLKHWMLEMGKTMQDAVVRAGRVAARSFGESTWPKTEEEGTNAVERQIKRVYASQGQAYRAILQNAPHKARAFWLLTGNRQHKSVGKRWKYAQSILKHHGGHLAGLDIKNFDGGKAHMALKRMNLRGRIPKDTRPAMVIKNESVGKRGTTALDRYIDKKQKLVGLTQSAWYNCMMLLGGRNRRSKSKGITSEGTEVTKPFSKWVIRHKGAGFGKVYFNEEAERFGVVLHNDIRWSQHALPTAAERWIMRQAREYLIKSMMIDIIEMRNSVERKSK